MKKSVLLVIAMGNQLTFSLFLIIQYIAITIKISFKMYYRKYIANTLPRIHTTSIKLIKFETEIIYRPTFTENVNLVFMLR